jgi:hypothetical protein
LMRTEGSVWSRRIYRSRRGKRVSSARLGSRSSRDQHQTHRRSTPFRTHGRPQLMLMLSRTRVRERQVLEQVLLRLLVLLLRDDDIVEVGVLASSGGDTGNLGDELLGVLVLLGAFAAPRALLRSEMRRNEGQPRGTEGGRRREDREEKDVPNREGCCPPREERRAQSLRASRLQSPVCRVAKGGRQGGQLGSARLEYKRGRERQARKLTATTLSPANALATNSLCLNANLPLPLCASCCSSPSSSELCSSSSIVVLVVAPPFVAEGAVI